MSAGSGRQYQPWTIDNGQYGSGNISHLLSNHTRSVAGVKRKDGKMQRFHVDVINPVVYCSFLHARLFPAAPPATNPVINHWRFLSDKHANPFLVAPSVQSFTPSV